MPKTVSRIILGIVFALAIACDAMLNPARSLTPPAILYEGPSCWKAYDGGMVDTIDLRIRLRGVGNNAGWRIASGKQRDAQGNVTDVIRIFPPGATTRDWVRVPCPEPPPPRRRWFDWLDDDDDDD